MTLAEMTLTGLVPPAKALSPQALLDWAKSQGVQEVDVKFTDLRGLWQHFSLPFVNFKADFFEEGIGFDGSRIRGFQDIQESYFNLIPYQATAYIDTITAHNTFTLLYTHMDHFRTIRSSQRHSS